MVFSRRILMVKSNDQVLNDDRASQLYQLVTTKVLYNLKPTFSGNDVKDVVQQTLESFNKSRVRLISSSIQIFFRKFVNIN